MCLIAAKRCYLMEILILDVYQSSERMNNYKINVDTRRKWSIETLIDEIQWVILEKIERSNWEILH